MGNINNALLTKILKNFIIDESKENFIENNEIKKQQNNNTNEMQNHLRSSHEKLSEEHKEKESIEKKTIYIIIYIISIIINYKDISLYL